MKTILRASLIFFLAISLSSCATIKDKINQTEQSGVEKVFDHPYNKVFESLEYNAVRGGWRIQESNIEDGYIYIAYTYSSFIIQGVYNAAITVKKIDDNKTLVKFLYFGSPYKSVRAKSASSFFSELESLLSRKE